MVKTIQDIWVMMDSGVVIFKRVFDEKVNAQLFGAMMAALDNFALEISGSLQSFEINSKKFTLSKHRNIIFVVNSDAKVKEKKLNQDLAALIDCFFNLYEVKLTDFDGEIDVFDGFERHIEEILEDPMKKFEKSFW